MDKDTLEWLETQRRLQNGTLDSWSLSFATDGFFIKLRGGEETESDPPFYLENISQYNKIIVQLYDRRDLVEDPQWDPLKISDYTFNFVVKVFPHIPISPTRDKRFKDQQWAFSFEERVCSFGEVGLCSLQEFDEILKYLIRMDKLAAFL